MHRFIKHCQLSVRQFLVPLLLLLSLLTSTLNAQPAPDPEAEARAALQRFYVAFNTGDNNEVREQLNFPNVTHGPNGLVIADRPEDFAIPFSAFRSQGWVRSHFDSITTHFVSEEKVNFGVEFTRMNALDEPILKGYVFYIFTKQDGHWGMQYRAGDVARTQREEAILEQARQEATAAVDQFFQAFNANDHAALALVHHVPQAIIAFENNIFMLANSIDSPLVKTDLDGLRARENWDHSEYEGVSIRSATPNRVIFELVFERVNTDGDVYMRIPATWVFVKQDERWGIQFRSLMASTISE